ncbi:ribokinase [Granulicella arctica]|uniref:ribokinase n=1 Tax=Granulicella arctica TaxID=940613 RepID=UPI0021DF8BB1|nr:ribokinase [Granulicella arctica]
MTTAKPVIVVGSLNVDLVVVAERFVTPGETMLGKSFRVVSGGKGANQAAASARLGYPTQLFGRVGDDGFGSRLIGDLEAAGVDVSGVGSVPGSTGTALITTVASGENSIVIVPGANGTIGPNDIDGWWPTIHEAGIVLAQLEIPMDAVEHLAKLCAEASIPFMLDPAPAQGLSAALLSKVAWLTPNESEVLALTGRDLIGAEEPALLKVAGHFLDLGVDGVVLKLGARGAYVATAKEQRWVRPFVVEAVDTTAAGDAFNGAFAASLLRLHDPFRAAQVAAAAAALSTTVPGAIPSMPSLQQVEALLEV